MFKPQVWIDQRKVSELQRFPEAERPQVLSVLDGEEVVIEHHVRHGKIICRFIPTPLDQLLVEDMRKHSHAEPEMIYQCGIATREAHEKEVIKKLKTGAPADELIEDFMRRVEIESVSFYEPVADLSKPYLFSEELKRALPALLNFIVEKLDVSRICLELDERQTLDFIPPKIAQHAGEMKSILVEDFLAKHTNEQELKQALRVRQGGARKRNGFVWSDKNRIAYYLSSRQKVL